MVYVLWILLHGPKRPFLSILVYILHILDCLGQDMQVLYLGRAPRTKETLPDFLKWRRVTRPPLVFRGLTGSQRTPGSWGVTVRPLEFYPPERNSKKNRNDFLFLLQFIPKVSIKKLPFYPSFINLYLL